MSTPLFLGAFIATALLAYLIVAVTAYRRMRGVRIIVCPETDQPAAIAIHAGAAALSAILEKPDITVARCSRWPERESCNQACTAQVAVAPKETLALSIARRWFAGQTCALCLGPIPMLSAHGAPPGLLDCSLQRPPDTVAWNDVPAESLPALFETHLPVCARCHEREHFGVPILRKPAQVEMLLDGDRGK